LKKKYTVAQKYPGRNAHKKNKKVRHVRGNLCAGSSGWCNNSKINDDDLREGKEVMTEWILKLLIETTNNRKIRKL
jgi:hypothetical protein